MNDLPHLSTRIFGQPLAIMPQKAEIILDAIGPRLFGGPLPIVSDTRIKIDASSLIEDEEEEYRPYELDGGIATIRVRGTLVQRSSWLGSLSGLVSYESFAKAFVNAMDDSAVEAIFLEVDSPGGEVSGLFDMVDSVAERLGEKPVHAHINELSASAAYAITTLADHISVPRTGTVGSVGVIVIHQEATKMLGKAGIKVNIIRAGTRKAETNPYEQLSDDGRRYLQSEVDRIRQIFVETVARNRGMDEQVIWDTEAQVYGAPDALKLGLVDNIMSAEQAAKHLVNTLG